MNCRFCPRVQSSRDHIGGPVAERGVALSGSRNRRSHESWVMCIVSSTMDSFFTLHQCSWRLLAALAREMQVVFWRSCLRVKLLATLAAEGACGLLSGAVLPSAFAELTTKSMDTAAIDGKRVERQVGAGSAGNPQHFDCRISCRNLHIRTRSVQLTSSIINTSSMLPGQTSFPSVHFWVRFD